MGILLLKLDNSETFNMAYHIIHWQKHETLLMNLSLVNQKFYVLERILCLYLGLVAKHYPKLHSTLVEFEIDPVIYASSWFITLFCNCLPACYAFRILECFLMEGEKVIYRVALMILKKKKKIIKRCDNLE